MLDPSLSRDTVIRAAAARREALDREAVELDGVLAAYTARPTCEPRFIASVAALQHYSMTEGTHCGCDTCVEWNTRRDEFIRASKLVPIGHRWSTCGCGICRFVGRIQLNFLAATNTRDLLIEISYHATHHSPFGTQVMRWLERELMDPMYTVNWRAQEMNRYPLERWLRRCESVLGPYVSGVVFGANMAVEHLPVHFASSLVAEGSYAN